MGAQQKSPTPIRMPVECFYAGEAVLVQTEIFLDVEGHCPGLKCRYNWNFKNARLSFPKRKPHGSMLQNFLQL